MACQMQNFFSLYATIDFRFAYRRVAISSSAHRDTIIIIIAIEAVRRLAEVVRHSQSEISMLLGRIANGTLLFASWGIISIKVMSSLSDCDKWCRRGGKTLSHKNRERVVAIESAFLDASCSIYNEVN